MCVANLATYDRVVTCQRKSVDCKPYPCVVELCLSHRRQVRVCFMHVYMKYESNCLIGSLCCSPVHIGWGQGFFL